jgi:hypothetical protein
MRNVVRRLNQGNIAKLKPNNMNILELSAVKNNLQLNAINKLQGKLVNAQKSKFDASIELSVLVKKSVDWYKSEEGKAIFKANNVKWNMDELAQNAFGWKKAYMYRMLKASSILEENPTTLVEFNAYIEEQDAVGKSTNRSIDAYIKFVEEGIPTEGEETAEGEEAEEETKSETVFTMSFKGEDGKNVAVRIDNSGNAVTTNEFGEIIDAVQFLMDAVAKLKNI